MSCLMLNGIVDTFLMEQPNIKVYISYPYEKSVHYAAKVVGDATEYSVNVGYKGYRTQKTKVKKAINVCVRASLCFGNLCSSSNSFDFYSAFFLSASESLYISIFSKSESVLISRSCCFSSSSAEL